MNDDNWISPEIQEYFLNFIPVQSTSGLNKNGIGSMNCGE